MAAAWDEVDSAVVDTAAGAAGADAVVAAVAASAVRKVAVGVARRVVAGVVHKVVDKVPAEQVVDKVPVAWAADTVSEGCNRAVRVAADRAVPPVGRVGSTASVVRKELALAGSAVGSGQRHRTFGY